MLLTCPAVMLLPGECWKRRDKLRKKRESMLRSYRRDPEKHRLRSRNWRLKDPERFRKQHREGARRRAPRYRKQQAEYSRKRYSQDAAHKMSVSMRNCVGKALRGKVRTSRTEDLLGCSFTFLRFWLESKFLPNMSWDNYGEWHVDHIRPLASFDLTDPKQQALAFHFLNLQPLWAKDNLSKGAKILDTCGPSDKGVCATVESHGQLLERAALESL